MNTMNTMNTMNKTLLVAMVFAVVLSATGCCKDKKKCEECWGTTCEKQMMSCLMDTQCSKLMTCYSDTPTKSNKAKCEKENPGKSKAWDDVHACYDTNCPECNK